MILTILKVIGIILLVLLLLIIFILALVLLAPIRYRFSAEYFDKPDVQAVVKYAPVGLNAQVTFKENGLQYTIRALGGVIMTNTGAKLSWLGRKVSGGQIEENGNAYAESDIDSSDINDIDTGYKIDNNEEIMNEADNYPESDNAAGDNITIDKETKKDKKKKKSKKEKDNRPLSEKIDEKIKGIKEKYADIRQKLSKLNKKKDSLMKVYKSKRFETAKVDVIKYIKDILRAIKPKHVEGRVHFGLDDPATTGEIMGGLATVLPLYDDFLDIRPDFERQIIEGLLKGYGKIRLWAFARIALKVIFNKNLIKVIKRVKTIVEA